MLRMQLKARRGWARPAMALAFGLCALGASGCATVVNGTKQWIAVDSKPSGVHVYVDGRSAGTTPCKVQLERSRDHTLRLVKGGYEETNYLLARHRPRATMGNIWLGGLFGFAVDAASGADYEFVPAAVHAELRPAVEAIAQNNGRHAETAPAG